MGDPNYSAEAQVEGDDVSAAQAAPDAPETDSATEDENAS